MGNFRERNFDRRGSGRSQGRSRRSDDRDNHGPKRFGEFERRDSRGSSFEKQMFSVTCDKCGSRCDVPFKPTGNKPVYCSDCFRKNEDSGSNNGSNKPDKLGKQLDEINEKLGKICEALDID